MKHGEYLVDLIDESGAIIGQKVRREIDKQYDLYHAVHTLLVTKHGEPIIATIPARNDLLNLYANLRGTTVATIRRTDETALSAAVRSLARELYLEGVDVHHLGDTFFRTGRIATYMSGFFAIHDLPDGYSTYDITNLASIHPVILQRQLRAHPEEFAPTFRHFWNRYRTRLPIAHV